MKSSNEIRRDFIEFFKSREHTLVPSSPLLPGGDPTLLFANAGMNQFKAIFLGTETRDYVRAANTQKCIRAGGKHNDLEDVGHDCYHHTFFEMLGNWSFGDYFKAETIEWAWELLTGVWGLPKDRLYATVFGGDAADGLAADDEAEQLWREKTDIDPSHILHGDKKDNFWEMGETGPCGPCSEIHIDLTDDGTGKELVNAGDARVIELWNLVFIQYDRDEAGKLSPLPAQHVDTGMGFERVTAVMQGKKSNYATDLFTPIIEKIETLCSHRYGESSGLADRFDVTSEDDPGDVACRVIADHARTLTFAIADGIMPSNEGRGYVVRRILRRAARYGRQSLGIEGPFLAGLVSTVVELMANTFPEIRQRQDYVMEIIADEEEAFGKTLDKGIRLWWSFAGDALKARADEEESGVGSKDRMVVQLSEISAGGKYDGEEYEGYSKYSPETNVTVSVLADGIHDGPRQEIEELSLGDITPAQVGRWCKVPPTISGEGVFKLYATYGFPADLTQLMAVERGMTVDMAGFEAEMAKHKELSGVRRLNISIISACDGSTTYLGDDADEEISTKVRGSYCEKDKDGNRADRAPIRDVGDEGIVYLRETNFRLEGGGQVGDSGIIRQGDAEFLVENTLEISVAGLTRIGHRGRLISGRLPAIGEKVFAIVDKERRTGDIARNHTATHLLNWALREVLGEHVNQAGSVVAADRLRFDFSHSQAVTDEQIVEVERLVNRWVVGNQPVSDRTVPLNEAMALPGLRAMFGEKYPDPVRVVMVGELGESAELTGDEHPLELCGGTHVGRTGEIGLFKVIGEESVAKGVRRITAVTGAAALEYVQQLEATAVAAARLLRIKPEQLPERIEAMSKELKELRKGGKAGGKSAGGEDFATIAAIDTPSGNVLVAQSAGGDAGAMRTFCDVQRQKGMAAVFVGGVDESKVMLVAMVSDELVKSGSLKAGDWVKAVAPIVGGGGGGKPNLAQAGGKQPDKLPDALQAAADYARDQLG